MYEKLFSITQIKKISKKKPCRFGQGFFNYELRIKSLMLGSGIYLRQRSS